MWLSTVCQHSVDKENVVLTVYAGQKFVYTPKILLVKDIVYTGLLLRTQHILLSKAV